MKYYGDLTNEPTKLEKDNRILSREIAEEGIVLLKNNGVLPLKVRNVGLYGVGARKTVIGGTGRMSTTENYSSGKIKTHRGRALAIVSGGKEIEFSLV